MESTTICLTLSPLTLHQTRGGDIRLKYGVIIATIYLIFFSKVKAWSCPSCFTPLQAFDATLRLQASNLIDSASSNYKYTGSIRQLCCVTISLARSPLTHREIHALWEDRSRPVAFAALPNASFAYSICIEKEVSDCKSEHML